MNETLRTVDGRPALRMERRLAHPPEKVWRAITEPQHLSQWYPFRVAELDPRVGGRIRFDDGHGTMLDAVVTELERPRVFAFEVAATEGTPGGREGFNGVHFELRPEGDGCLLVFTHVFDDRPAAASFASGWQACLDAMEQLLDGRPVEVAGPTVEAHEAFVTKFGLDRGTAEDTADGWRVRFERQLMHLPVDRFWAVTTADGDAPAVGGPPPRPLTCEQVPAGPVTAVDPPRLLEYEWRSGGRPAGRVRWELSEGPGGARIELTQTGPAGLAGERAAALAAWQAELARLVERCRR